MSSIGHMVRRSERAHPDHDLDVLLGSSASAFLLNHFKVLTTNFEIIMKLNITIEICI